MFGGDLFSLKPNPSSSCSINFLCFNGLSTSKTININEHVRATAITCRPRPFPSLAPSMIPGKSKSYKYMQYKCKYVKSININHSFCFCDKIVLEKNEITV